MKLFGRFLVQRGLATADQVVEALDRQRTSRQTIGQIGVRLCGLTARQVLDVLNRQVLGDAKPFGEIAVSLGYLKPEGVILLLAEQERSTQALAQVLVEMGVLSDEAVKQALEVYLASPEATEG